MKKARACIIGCGYVGSALCTYWKAQGAHTCVTTTSPQRTQELQQLSDKVVCLEKIGLKALQGELAACDVVVVTVAPKSRSLQEYRTCYLDTVKTLLDLTKETGSSPHLLYTSSTSVYGDWQGGEVVESDLPGTLDPYAAILHEAEKLLLQARHITNVTILRLGEIIGPKREMLERLRAVLDKPFAGDGSRFVNVSHLSAIVQALHFCYKTKTTGLYNLCSACHPTRGALYRSLAQQEGLPLPIWDSSLKSSHQGNKKVISQKIADAGFTYPEEALQ